MSEQDGSEANGGGRRVELDLALPRPIDPAGTRRVHVVVEDISRADGRATVLYETEVDSPPVRSDGSLDPIRVDLPDLPPAVEPAIRVHVDEGATGAMTTGDFINPAVVRLPDGPQSVVDVSMTELR